VIQCVMRTLAEWQESEASELRTPAARTCDNSGIFDWFLIHFEV
jgi:hypothetical protein